MLTPEQKKQVLDNKNLVNPIVSKYMKATQTMTYADLYQVGIEGLIQAVQKYNPDSGYQFSTYATCQIKYSILNAIQFEDRIVYVPPIYYKTALDFKKQHQETGISIENYAKQNGVLPETIKAVLCAMRPIIYLEQPHIYSDDEFEKLMDLLTDDKPSYESSIQYKDFQERLYHGLRQLDLPPKHIQIFEEYYGLNGGDGKNSSDLSKEFSLSQTRIMQIIHKIERMLQARNIITLEDYSIFTENEITDYE